MVFPADIETFPTWENKNLTLGILGSPVDAVILNKVFDLLEAIQNSLGANFISGYSDLKDKLDSWQTAFPTLKVKAVDGNGLLLEDDGGNGIFIKDGGNVGIGESDPVTKLFVGGNGIGLNNNVGIIFKNTGDTLRTCISYDFNDNLRVISVDGDIELRTTESQTVRFKVRQNGIIDFLDDMFCGTVLKGVVVRTPDGTKNYRLGVDNSGNVISTLVV